MYSDTRCGFFHDWMARRRIGVTDRPELIRVFGGPGRIDMVVINVNKFLAVIEAHFTRYVRDLQDTKNTALRAAFNAGWNTRNATPGRRAKKSTTKKTR